MVLIDGKKFACETCIKGHRSSACKHTDRPLSEIHKKGRPVTQCSHCRELRKTKQMHVKCNCGGNKEAPSRSSAEIAQPPQQVPKVIRVQPTSSTSGGSSAGVPSDHSSDSEPGSSKTQQCNCDSTGECHCCEPRKAKARRRRPIKNVETIPRELRHVLPKPPKPPSSQGPVHIPSSPPLPPTKHHSHAEVLYSPYGRAYEASHSYEPSTEFRSMDFSDLGNNVTLSNVIVTSPDGQAIPWDTFNTEPIASRAVCACGPSCSCPGCFEHRDPVVAVQALLCMQDSGCTNPAVCTSCVECSVILPPPQPLQTDMQDVEEWLRQLTSPLPLTPEGGNGSNQSFNYRIRDQLQHSVSTSGYNDSGPSVSTGDWLYNEHENTVENCNCPRCERDGHHFGLPHLALSAERTSYPDVLAPQFVDNQRAYLNRQVTHTPPASEVSHSSRQSRASSMSASDGEHWNGLRANTALRTKPRANSASVYEESDII